MIWRQLLFLSSFPSRFLIPRNPVILNRFLCNPVITVQMLKRSASNSPVKVSPLKKNKETEEETGFKNNTKENMAPVVDQVVEGTEISLGVGQEVRKSPVKMVKSSEGGLKLFFAKMSDKAHMPTKGSKLSAGFDLKR